jgi:hypothetical protein
MSAHNRFEATVSCPSCGQSAATWFQADIGTLRYELYQPGDQVIFDVPPKKPYGPSIDCDFTGNFWAVGLGRCPVCLAELRVRVHVHDRHFAGTTPAQPDDSDWAWGRCDGGDAS